MNSAFHATPRTNTAQLKIKRSDQGTRNVLLRCRSAGGAGGWPRSQPANQPGRPGRRGRARTRCTSRSAALETAAPPGSPAPPPPPPPAPPVRPCCPSLPRAPAATAEIHIVPFGSCGSGGDLPLLFCSRARDAEGTLRPWRKAEQCACMDVARTRASSPVPRVSSEQKTYFSRGLGCWNVQTIGRSPEYLISWHVL